MYMVNIFRHLPRAEIGTIGDFVGDTGGRIGEVARTEITQKIFPKHAMPCHTS